MKWARISLVALAAAALSGCLDYAETLYLEDDGSGRIVMDVQIDREFLEKMKSMSEQFGSGQADGPFDDICSEEEVRANLANMNSKIDLIRYETSETDKLLKWNFEFAFTSQDDFDDLTRACPDEEESSEDSRPAFAYSFEQDGGHWQFLRELTAGGDESGDLDQADSRMDGTSAFGGSGGLSDAMNESDSEGEDENAMATDPEAMKTAMDQLDEVMKQLQKDNPEAAAEMEAQLSQAMAGYGDNLENSLENAMTDMANHYMTFEVHFPGRVNESNATAASGNVATWKYPLNEFQNAPGHMTATIDR
jgi:hypothetical protein